MTDDDDRAREVRMRMGQNVQGFMDETDNELIDHGNAVDEAVTALTCLLRSRGLSNTQIAGFVIGATAAVMQESF